MNIFASCYFTALCNGKISALIAFVRTIVFEIGAVLLLPVFFGVNGVWMALPVAESMALVLSVACLVRYRKRYHYA